MELLNIIFLNFIQRTVTIIRFDIVHVIQMYRKQMDFASTEM